MLLSLRRSVAARLQSEDGYTIVTIMAVISVIMLGSVAAFAATNGDLKPGGADKDRKAAYAAAEAGVNDYLARLIARPDYWRDCDDPNNQSLNPHNPGAARTWAPVPGGSTAAYSVELMPANNMAQCDINDPVGTFIDTDTGTFRIRSTGRASTNSSIRRSVIATFRRRGFLDYIYFTDFETNDPIWYLRNTGNPPRLTRENGPLAGNRDVVTWATQECGKYWRAGRNLNPQFRGDNENLRGLRRTSGLITDPAGWDDHTERCDEIRFVGSSTTKDYVNGPLHSNDELYICGTPHFGRRPADTIEVSAPAPGWRPDPGCAGSTPEVNFNGATVNDRGTFVPNSPLVTLPPNNVALKDDALPAYRFTGRTTIVMNGTTMTVTNNSITKTMQMPKDGVIFVGNDTSGSCAGYNPNNPNGGSTTCGDVYLQGTYDKSLTITAENDIVIRENVQASGTGKPLLGLISTNWIRVYHPVDSSCENAGGPSPDLRIDAAILSLQHSFTVDHYWCGNKLGNLTVNGAIGQKYRGPVGTGGATGGTGYIKDYNYNNELRFRSPPRFLDPVQTTWKLRSQVEQVPAAS
jgi:hypothetical protein